MRSESEQLSTNGVSEPSINCQILQISASVDKYLASLRSTRQQNPTEPSALSLACLNGLTVRARRTRRRERRSTTSRAKV